MTQAQFGDHRAGDDGAQSRAEHRGARLPRRGLEPGDGRGWKTSCASTRTARFTGARTLEELVAALERPRRIMMMIPAGEPVDDMIGQAAAAARGGRHPDRRRQLAVRGHPAPRSSAPATGAEFRRLRRLGRRGRRAVRPVDHAGRIGGGVARIKDVLEAHRRQDRSGPVRDPRRSRRRRALREDGAQRDRVRRHADHRRDRTTCCIAASG